MANGRCRVHGGASCKGAAHPNYRHGLRSKYLKFLPKHLGPVFRAALSDPDLTCLKEELAVQSARIADLLDQVSRGDGPTWGSLVLAADAYQMAKSKGQDTGAAADYLDALVRDGAACARTREATWAELRGLMQDKTKTAAAESKRLAVLNGYVTVEQALLFVTALLAAAKEVVADKVVLRALQEKMLLLLPPASDEGPARPPVVLDNGHAGEAEAPVPGPAPGPAADSIPRPAGARPAPTPPPPDPPGPGPHGGLRERPPPPDEVLGENEEWQWVPDGQEDDG
jgi:hypothetical protein